MFPIWKKWRESQLSSWQGCKKNDLFYQSICHPLRLLKIPQVAKLGDLHCLKGTCFFWILVQSHCPWKLPTKLCALIHPLSLLANQERPGQIPGKGQVQLHQLYKEEPLSDILCSHACSLLIKRTCLVKIFCLLCVCFQPWGVFNSNRASLPGVTALWLGQSLEPRLNPWAWEKHPPSHDLGKPVWSLSKHPSSG
jgi:hypothetical protein